MSNVAFKIEVLIETFQQDSDGKKPAGIVVGPREYRELCYLAQKAPGYLRDAQVQGELPLITEYKGFPLYVKEMPGIDLMISYQEAFHAAYR